MAILNIWINILLKILDNNISINRQNSMVGIFFTQKSETERRILYIERHFYERWQSIIGHIKARRVRIYKLNTFKALSDDENEIYNDKKKKNADLLEAIHNNKSFREVPDKYLNERNEIAIFENDIVRLALAEIGRAHV